MSRRDSIQSRMRRLVVIFCAVLAAILAVMLALVLVYNSQYTGLLYNVTTASEFNQDFKENIDLKMYYYVIESQYSDGLPIQEVEAAQELARDLLSTTSQKDSLRAVTSVLDLCENLEEKIYQIQQTQSYDERQMQLENNVYVLTAMIQEYMYNYLYCESVQLNLLQQQISRQIAAEIFLVLVLAAALILLLVRYSVRLARSVTQPVVDLSRRAEDVIGGDLTAREPVRSETYEIRTLSEGMEQMISRINAQIREITQKQASLRRAELALLQAQINPHFLYNTMDTIIWLIEAGRPQAAVEMVSNLSDFFRHSLSRGEDVITLGEEERHVRSYLQIQQARYQDILEYTIGIGPGLQGARLPKLTLQPLVENALYHGIKLKRDRGCIYVTGRVEGTDILIQVTDDGAGMAPERHRYAEERPFSRAQAEAFADEYIKLLEIKTASADTPIKSLSGGNQQKCILARWLLTDPKYLILDEPTRGIDIGTKIEIQKLVLKLAAEGKSVTFISSEIDEMLRTCSRLVVMRDRKAVGELAGEDLTQAKIMATIAGGDEG